MTESSGVFSFPVTGLYQVITKMAGIFDGPDNGYLQAWVTQDNSSYDHVGSAGASQDSTYQNDASVINFVNVTNISNVKIRFATLSMATNSGLIGSSVQNTTCFTFIRMGDSQ